MSVQNRGTLKSFFETGEQPTQENFEDLIDSMLLVSGDTATGTIVLNADPVNGMEAATKNYVDNLVESLSWKESVVAATTANITLSGNQTIDGVAVVNNNRVLVKNQSTAKENGIYVVASGAWSRAADNDTGAEIANTTVFCEGGATNAGTQWNCSDSSITLGSTNITFVKIAGAGTYTNGSGLSLSSNVFSIDSTVATLTGTQTLTNKTLTSPAITSPTGLVKADVGLGNVDNTSDTTKNAASATLTNKTLTSPKINVGSDATGDLYYRDSGGNLVRLSIGTSGQVLKGGTTPSFDSLVSVLGYTPLNLNGDTMTGLLVLSADPSAALGAATKSYVDNLISGLSWKQSVVAATTANITLSGNQTIDGISVVTNDRVLVKNQTTATGNGIYIAAAGAWSRATDNDTGPEIASTTVLCEAGTVNGGSQWNCSNSTITLGSTNITFVQIAGAGVYTSGTGLSLTGNVFSIDSTVVTLTGAQTLTTKILTSPTVNGGALTALTNLAIRDTSAAFDVTIAATSSSALTANRTLTIDMINTARSIKLGGNITTAADFITSGANSLTLTTTGTTNVTLPTSGTLAVLASPAFSGTPTSTTAAVDTNTTQIATTAFVIGQGYAKLASPSLTTPNIGVASGTSLATTGTITSSGTAGIGYATGAGGTVTQATSKSTGVTLNKICGEITMNAALLSGATTVSFTLTNSTIGVRDVLILNHASAGTGGSYALNAQAASGSATINVRNLLASGGAGNLSEAIVIRFVVIKAVNS